MNLAIIRNPLDSSSALSDSVTSLHPGSRRVGFTSRSPILGSAASVVRYNTFSRLLAPLCSPLFGIPTLCYFDDSGFIAPESVCREDGGAFQGFFSILAVSLRPRNAHLAPLLHSNELRPPPSWAQQAQDAFIFGAVEIGNAGGISNWLHQGPPN